MNKFGFSLSVPRVIDYDSNDRSAADLIASKEPTFRLCIECGTCAATCTAGKFTDFSLREINVLLRRGENNAAAGKINRCMLCGKCILVCPRGVNTRNVLFIAREILCKTNGHERF